MREQPSAAGVVTFFPKFCTDLAVAHTCFSLARSVRSDRLRHRMVVVQGSPRVMSQPWVRAALPPGVAAAGYRAHLGRAMSRLAERTLVRTVGEGEAVWLWPGARLKLIPRLQSAGHTVLTERINCHRATAKRILEEAYAKLGLEPRHGLLPELEQHERAELAMVDAVFSPSPNVTASLIDEGVAPDKIMESSYGWDPARLRPPDPAAAAARRKDDGLTVLFVGRICIRKGAHLLLRAWAKSGVYGRLILMGRLDDEIARACAGELLRDDVQVRPFERNVASVYAAADVFALPSLEEGSPLVVYEALASGLPVITTPMGAGSVVRDGIEGRVADPYDTDRLIEALRSYAADEDLRRETAVLARLRADEYTWERVGQHRAAMLTALLRGEPVHADAAPTPAQPVRMAALVEPRESGAKPARSPAPRSAATRP